MGLTDFVRALFSSSSDGQDPQEEGKGASKTASAGAPAAKAHAKSARALGWRKSLTALPSRNVLRGNTSLSLGKW